MMSLNDNEKDLQKKLQMLLNDSELVKKYKTYLVQATNTPLWCFYVISCLPPIIARGCNGFIKRYYKYAKYIRKFLLRKT